MEVKRDEVKQKYQNLLGNHIVLQRNYLLHTQTIHFIGQTLGEVHGNTLWIYNLLLKIKAFL